VRGGAARCACVIAALPAAIAFALRGRWVQIEPAAIADAPAATKGWAPAGAFALIVIRQCAVVGG
jgi:hypothetical protein